MTARAGRAARVAAVLLLAALPFQGGLLRGELIASRDLPSYFYPRSAALGVEYAAGRLPRWDPLVFHGASWFGTRSPGVFYPPNAVFGLLPLGLAMATFMALHAGIAALGARALLREVAGPSGGWAAGVAFGLGGFVVSQHWVLTYQASAALLPWAALGGRLAATRPLRGAGVVAAALGLILLDVDPQGALVATGVALGLAASAAAPGRRARALLAVGVGLGAVVAAAQLVPLLLELPRTDRALSGWGDGRYGAPPLGLLATFVAPGVLGEHSRAQLGYWGRAAWSGEVPWCSLHVGVAGVAAIAAGLASPARRRLAGPGLVLLALGLAAAWADPGRYLGLRFSAKWLVLSALGLAWLIGVGWRELFGSGGRLALRCYAALAVTLVVLAALLSAVYAPALTADRTLDEVAVRLSAGGAAVRLGIFALALVAVTRLAQDGLLGPVLARSIALGLLALELASIGASGALTTHPSFLDRPLLAEAAHAVSTRPPRVPPTLFATPESAGSALVDPRREDPHAASLRTLREVLKPNLGQLHGVRSVFAFESTRSSALLRLLAAVREGGVPTPRALALLDAELFVASRGSPSLGLADVAVVATLLDGRRLGVRNLTCPPWAYVAGEARGAATEEAAVAATIASDRVITRSVVLGPEGADLAGESAVVSAPSSATVGEVEFAAERVALTVTSDAPGWLVVRESSSSDWRATVEGAPAPMARADALFRALRVPAGRSRVVMVYDPWWWTPSLLLSALGLVGLAGLVVLDRRGNREAAGGTS